MQEKSLQKIDDTLLEQVIEVAYNEAGWLKKLIVHRKAKKDPVIKGLLYEYSSTAEAVHNLKEKKLPESIIESVYSKTTKSRQSSSHFVSAYSRLIARPMLSAGIATVMLLITSIIYFYQPDPEIKYTQYEIEVAQEQLQQSFAIINKVFKNAERQLDDEILPNHVDKHLNKGLNFINDILIGG